MVMGYNISGFKTLSSKEILVDVECPYAWEPIFKRYLQFQPQDLSGRITLGNIGYKVEQLKKLEKTVSENKIHQWQGNLSNCTNEKLRLEFRRLIHNIINRNVKYLLIT